MNQIKTEWRVLVALAGELPSEYRDNEAVQGLDWPRMPVLLTAACSWDAETLKAVRELLNQTILMANRGERPGVICWLHKIRSGWADIPERLPVEQIRRFN